ncbi:MAG: HAMP domain-containing protein, partial [Acidobacteria bacterium]|nr:HAMP domain-containing protein [Acidobacteriota bacterium]
MATKRSRWNVRGIQARVGVLVVLGVLTSMLSPGWIAWQSLGALTERILVERESVAATVVRHVDNVVAREWSKLQDVATGPGMGAARPGETETAQILGSLRMSYLRAELMHQAYVTDASGRVCWQEPATTDRTGVELPGAREALRAGRPTTTGLVTGPNGPALFLFVPIRTWTGQIAGLVAGEIDPKGSRLVSILRSHPVDALGSIDLVDASGVIVASSDPARQSVASDHRQLLANLIRNGGSTRGTCHSCHDGPQSRTTDLMAFVSARDLGWGVRVREPESVSLAQVNSLRRTLLVLAPILLGLGLLFAYGAAQSLLRPLGVLTRAAERIASGEMDPSIPDLGEDEVGRLGRSLEHMRATLRVSMETIEQDNLMLERRVEERTHELEGLYRQLAERDEARGRLLRQVITAQEDERKRLARELHDETCQTISALNMRLETAVARWPPGVDNAPLLEARSLAVRTLDELHRLIYDLRPSVLDDLGLWSAISWYAERQLKPKGVLVRCEFSDVDRRLPALMETALFRVAQEAISNIAKHAQAEQALIQCGIQDDVLTIEIEDDGNGFE